MSSSTDKISGKTKQTLGKITGSKKLQAKGKVEEVKGKVKRDVKHAGDKIAD